MQKPYPCLWFDTEAEEARKFYLSVFRNSKKGATTYYDDFYPEKKGKVLTAMFEIEGQKFMALNAGPDVKFTPAISLVVGCKTQKELDTLWKSLLKGGGRELGCGWLTDKFGVSWQIAPAGFEKMLTAKDKKKTARYMQALGSMKKLDIARLKKAYEGK
jgi:predicted 3-demethylubiquinone-9 3-methyltransferase (glyoxalase superfamily)